MSKSDDELEEMLREAAQQNDMGEVYEEAKEKFSEAIAEDLGVTKEEWNQL